MPSVWSASCLHASRGSQGTTPGVINSIGNGFKARAKSQAKDVAGTNYTLWPTYALDEIRYDCSPPLNYSYAIQASINPIGPNLQEPQNGEKATTFATRNGEDNGTDPDKTFHMEGDTIYLAYNDILFAPDDDNAANEVQVRCPYCYKIWPSLKEKVQH
ncbi:hypothetical protein RJ55_01457 [Drechmeria coniospora]|nr:hypothetical protein RJ55_01457 [Drechmeria coniospora]